MIRTRIEPSANYRSVFLNGKTIRMPIDPAKPVTELRFPEFYDIGINTRCYGGCHKYCYTSAVSNGVNFPNVERHIESFFGNMTQNQRPFQVAIGASGEATLHDRFCEVLRLFKDLGIVPNYTTNAMHMTDEVMEATKQYCGGVAITLHRLILIIGRRNGF